MRTADDDLTARARIRDAAVLRFATDGFGAPVRAIAADVGVSPALVIHHFGSKDALRKECDEYILTTTRQLKNEAIDEAAAGQSLLHRFAAVDESAHLLGYVLRSLQDGGPVAQAFIEQMVDDAVDYTRKGVAAGVIHPSRDEAARVRYLVLSSLGALLLEVTLDPPDDPRDLSALVRDFLTTSYAPMLELFTQGLFTSSYAFDEYVQSIESTEREKVDD
ncbi:MAG: TetR family transcriptional regulator [Nocardioides sp.]|nr:TetR family transcriptional regulator [Nocardioides sp.]